MMTHSIAYLADDLETAPLGEGPIAPVPTIENPNED